MTRFAATIAVASVLVLGPVACSNPASGPDGGGVCHSAKESCTESAECCSGFICLGGFCSFTGSGISGQTGGSSGGASTASSTGGSTGRATTSGGSSGSSGSSAGGSTGGSGGCAALGGSCTGAPCCTPYDADAGTGNVCLYGSTCELCEAQGSFCQLTTDCCGGLVCAGGTCSVPTNCSAYADSCAALSCCNGLSCDASSQTCLLPDGGSCAGGELCAAPFTCLPTQVCGVASSCAGYGDFCGATNCCSGLSCDPTYEFCYVETGAPCAGRMCAPPDTCASGTCAPATNCSPYGTSCATTGCCTGLTCDSATKQCSVADGGPCAFSDGGATVEFCAPPFTCTQYGICGVVVPCGGYGGGSGCSTASIDCCPGLTCDSTYDACYDGTGTTCTGIDTYCANGGICNDAGVCGGAATCEGYGIACGTLGCCAGLTCDSTYDACYDALGSACTGSDTYCANGNVCSGGVCALSSSCTGYGLACDSTTCCTGLACDSNVGVCYIADGYDCLNETCATPYSCIADVCQ